MFTFMHSTRLVLFCCFLSASLIISPCARAGYDDWQRQPDFNNGIVINAASVMLIYVNNNFGDLIFTYLWNRWNNGHVEWPQYFAVELAPTAPQFHLSMVYEEAYPQPPVPVPAPIPAQIVDRFGIILTPPTRNNMPKVFINEFAAIGDTHITMGRGINAINDPALPIYYYYPEFRENDRCFGYKPYKGASSLCFDRENFIRYMHGELADAYDFDGNFINALTINPTNDANEISDRYYAVEMLLAAWEDATTPPDPPVPVPPPPLH